MQRGGVVTQDPTLVGCRIAVRGPRDVHQAIGDGQGGPLVCGEGVERDVALRVTADAGAGHLRLNNDGAPRALLAIANIDGVQALHELSGVLRFDHEVDGLVRLVDDRRADNADAAGKVPVGPAVLTDVGAIQRDDTRRGVDIADGPQRTRRRRVVGVEGVEAVVHGRDIDHISHAYHGDVDPRHVQRLAVDLIVDAPLEELAKLGDIDVAGREPDLLEESPSASDVVVKRRNVDLGEGRYAEEQHHCTSHPEGQHGHQALPLHDEVDFVFDSLWLLPLQRREPDPEERLLW